jgi:WD40 repeat protein
MSHRKLLLLSAIVLALAFTADATQQPPVPADLYGDALPEGAVARLGTVRWRHGGMTTFAAFLPDGKTVISASVDSTIRVWEYPSGKELRRFGPPAANNPMIGLRPPGLAGAGLPVALSKDGKAIAASFDRVEVRLYEVATGKELAALKAGGAGVRGINGLAFTPDGRQLAMLSPDGSVRIWDWANAKKEVSSFTGPGNAVIFAGNSILAYSPDGKYLTTIKVDLDNNTIVQALIIWDAAAGKEISSIPAGGGGRIASLSPVFSPDSKTLAYVSGAGNITLVEAATGKEIRSWKCPPGSVLLFSRDGTKLYGRSFLDKAVLEWDVASGKELRKMPLATVAPERGTLGGGNSILGLSSDGNLLALAGSNNALQFLDMVAGKEVGTGAGSAAPMAAVHFTADGKHLFSRGSDGTVHRWDAATGKALELLATPRSPLQGMISPDGKVLLIPSAQGCVLVDAATGKELATIASNLRGLVQAALFSPDGKLLAVRQAQEKKIELYEVPTGKLLHTIGFVPGGPMPGDVVRQPINIAPPVMFFAPDSKTLAAFADPNMLGLWDTASGQRVGSVAPTVPAVHSGAFSPDGRCIALDMNDGTVALHEVASGQVRRTFGTKVPQPKNPGFVGGGFGGPINSPLSGTRVAFTPDGQTLLHAGLDLGIHVWDIVSGQELKSFKGHSGAVNAVAVAPNGKMLASASADTTALVWDLTRVVRPAPAVKVLTADQRDTRWQALLTGDAAQAFTAIWELSASPKETLALIMEQVQPAPAVDGKRIEQLIADLDSDQFKVRQQANAELLKLDERVVPLIDKVLASNPPLETKKRLDDLRKQLAGVLLRGERLRMIRAVEVLERIGTPEARQLLQALADGAPGALLTTTAQTALQRLGQAK